MDQPWGVSGPDFLRAYLIAAAFAVLLAAAARITARTGKAVEVGGVGLTELAYLAGGPRRVVELSLARLLDRGALRVNRDGQVQAVDGVRVGGDSVDRAVGVALTKRKARAATLVVGDVAGSAAVTAVAEGMVRRGLLVAGRRRWARLSALPMAVVSAVGLLRWLQELRLADDTGWLTVAVIGTFGLTALIWTRPIPPRTYAGEKALVEFRRGGPAAPDIATKTARDGLAGHPDFPAERPVRRQAAKRVRSGQRASSSAAAYGAGCGGDFGGSSCGGSSCGGGGSSCGGGGGGCGGGGGS
ncbi:uncharacterized protein (TIGR04222 family) [Actinokineospora baliensis]|uniref:TIGR04222 domain-containing membrane protein n=1 Tax=Actinokineospora baliensis TaxID=547056 RepID=UPI00195EAA26|nr:TIGR04222 domain-containing membrane protein [Actinokineospora baliensis]MBM7776256.1 uncharacterized protein (TIGR04222 family) [Actinokineospora baliensis]